MFRMIKLEILFWKLIFKFRISTTGSTTFYNNRRCEVRFKEKYREEFEQCNTALGLSSLGWPDWAFFFHPEEWGVQTEGEVQPGGDDVNIR